MKEVPQKTRTITLMERNLNNSSLTPEQRARLLEAIVAKRKRQEEAGLFAENKNENAVSNEEYQRRLRESMMRDQEIIQSTQQVTLQQRVTDWETQVGPRFAKAKIEDDRIKALVDEKIERIRGGSLLHRNGLVLSGIVGGGKTWTAYAYARMLIESGFLLPSSVVHGTETGLLLPLTLGFDKAEKTQDFLNQGKKFYLIDDTGLCNYKSPEQRQELWFQLVNHAYENHIPLVVTTSMSTVSARNGQKSQLELWIGEAAYDRLKNIADVIIPSDSNKRSMATGLMDKGKIHGMGQMNSNDFEQSNNANQPYDPFSGLEDQPTENPVRKAPTVSGIKKSLNELRPKR